MRIITATIFLAASTGLAYCQDTFGDNYGTFGNSNLYRPHVTPEYNQRMEMQRQNDSYRQQQNDYDRANCYGFGCRR